MLDIFRPSKWKGWGDNPITNTFKPSHWDGILDNPIVNGVEDFYNTATLQDDDDIFSKLPSLTNGFGTSKGLDLANGNFGGFQNFGDPFSNEDQINEAVDSLNQAGDYLGANYLSTQQMLRNYLGSVNDLYGDSKANRDNALNEYKSIGEYQPGEYKFKGDVNDYMSPAMGMRIKEANKAITKSQANAGNMFSSDYLDALNAKSQAIASEEYDKAYDRYMNDRDKSLNEWKANQEEKQKAYDTKADLYKNLADAYGSDLTNYSNGLSDYYSNLIDSSNAYTQGLVDLNTAKANAKAQEKGFMDNLGGIGGLLGGIAAVAALA